MLRWDPFEDILTLQSQINRLFESSVRRGAEGRAHIAGTAWTPQVDVWETDEELRMKVDLPDVKLEDINLHIEGDQMVLKGERKASDAPGKVLRQERVFGPFYRAFTLSLPVDSTKVKATYKNGVLEIVLPKKEEVKPRQIKIAEE